MAEFDVVNLVGTISYRQELDLEALAETFTSRREITNVTYEPADTHWLQTRFAPDDTYVAFYRSGSASIAGCGSVDQFYRAADSVNNVMRELLNFDYRPELEVSNIVATADIGTAVPLEVLAVEFGLDQIEYEPEQFPALMYRGPDYTMLIFGSGKVLCTGLTEIDAVSEALEEMTPRIQRVTNSQVSG